MAICVRCSHGPPGGTGWYTRMGICRVCGRLTWVIVPTSERSA